MNLAAASEETNYSNGLPSDRAHDRKSKRKGVATPIRIKEMHKAILAIAL
jgi:hypothetical protein